MEDCKLNEALIRAEGHPNAVVKCWFCNTNGCNGATRFGPIFLLVALPLCILNLLQFKVNQ